MFESPCPQCLHGHILDEAERGELVACKKCSWRFVALPPATDSVLEAHALLTALWPYRPQMKICDQRFLDMWAQSFIRRGADLCVGCYRLEYLRRTAYDHRHFLNQATTLRKAV